MRSEGFLFNSWGSGGRALFATRCFYVRNRPQPFATVGNRSQPFATVRNRPQPSTTVRSRTLRRCHWGKLLQVTFHGCVTCQFAPLFHCDLHEHVMSRKKRDAFRCTGAAFCEIRNAVPLGLAFGESCFWGVGCGRAIGICVSGCFRDKSQLKCRFWWMGVCSEQVEIIPNVWCGANFVEAHMR